LIFDQKRSFAGIIGWQLEEKNWGSFLEVNLRRALHWENSPEKFIK
jgi:hypothetical protein